MENKKKKMTDNLSSASEVSDPLEIVYTNVNKYKVKVGSRKRKNKDSTKRLNNNTGKYLIFVRFNICVKVFIYINIFHKLFYFDFWY